MAKVRRRSSAADPTGEFPLDLTTYLFHLFAAVGRHRETQLDHLLQPLGLNLSRHRALSVIASQGALTMTELADYSAIDRTTMTRIVDQLVEAGLVERETPKADRRQVVLTLTDKGRAASRESLKVIWRHNGRLLDGVAEARQREMARGLEAFIGRLIDDAPLLARLRFDALRAGDD
jgi:DNA-binding MarR family transcriptional regulator